MKESLRLPVVFAAAAFLAAAVAVVAVFSARLERGDFVARYSSLRADPVGTKALYETLAGLPGVEVRRHHGPRSRLDAGAGTVVVVPGFAEVALRGRDPWRERLKEVAEAGARVVIFADPPVGQTDEAATEGEVREARAEERRPEVLTPEDRLRIVSLGTEEDGPEFVATLVSGEAGSGWPEAVVVRSDSGLEPVVDGGGAWRPLYAIGDVPVALRRAERRGETVVFSGSYPVSNEALAAGGAGALIAALVSDRSRVVFLESHLGVTNPETLADLAVGYGLGPAMVALVVAAGLGIWRASASLVPPAAVDGVEEVAGESVADLARLFARALPPAEVPAALVAAAERSGRLSPERLARVRLAASGVRAVRGGLAELYRRMAAGARRAPAAVLPRGFP